MNALVTCRGAAMIGFGLVVGVFTNSSMRRQDGTMQRKSIDADDLAAVTGLNIYKFEINFPRGHPFWIILREFREDGKAPRVLHRYLFQKSEDGPSLLQVAFLRLDGKMEGVLSGPEKQARYDISLTGCSRGGFGTIVPVPLADLPPAGKVLAVHPTHQDRTDLEPGQIALLTLVAGEPGKVTPLTAFPRAELIISDDGGD